MSRIKSCTLAIIIFIAPFLLLVGCVYALSVTSLTNNMLKLLGVALGLIVTFLIFLCLGKPSRLNPKPSRLNPKKFEGILY